MEVSSLKKDGIEYFLNFLKTRTALTIKKIQKKASQQNIQNGDEGMNSTPKNESVSLTELQLKEQHSSNNNNPVILRERSKTPPSIIEENLKKKQEFEQKQVQGFKNLIQNVLQPSLKSQTSSQINAQKTFEKEESFNKQLTDQNNDLAESQKSKVILQETNEQTPNKTKQQKNSKDILEENVLIYSFNNPNQELGFLSFKKDLNNQNAPNKQNQLGNPLQNKQENDHLNATNSIFQANTSDQNQKDEISNVPLPNSKPIQINQSTVQKSQIDKEGKQIQSEVEQQIQQEKNKLILNEENQKIGENNQNKTQDNVLLNQQEINSQQNNSDQVNQQKEEQNIQKSDLETSQNIKQDNTQKQKEEAQQKPQRKSNLSKIEELQKNLKRLKELEKSKQNKSRLDSSLSQTSNTSLPLIESISKIQITSVPQTQVESQMPTKDSSNMIESKIIAQNNKNLQNEDQSNSSQFHSSEIQNSNFQDNNNQTKNSLQMKQNTSQDINLSVKLAQEINVQVQNDQMNNDIQNEQIQSNIDEQEELDKQNRIYFIKQQSFQPSCNNIQQNESENQNVRKDSQRVQDQQGQITLNLNQEQIPGQNENNLQVPKRKESNNINTDSTGTFGNKNSIYSININTASIDNRKQQAQNMIQSEVIQEQTPMFNYQNISNNNSSKGSNEQQYPSLNQQNQLLQTDSNKQNGQRNNMLGSFERRLVDENDNYNPMKYQKLAPARQSYDKDPKIPSLMVQSYLTNYHGDEENEAERYRSSKSDLSNLKSEIIRKPLQLEQINNNNYDKNSRNNTQRQLEDLDNQIKQIIQGDSNQGPTQKNNNNNYEDDDSEFFSDIKFVGDKMLQTKERVPVDPDKLYLDKKQENNIRFTQSTFNQNSEQQLSQRIQQSQTLPYQDKNKQFRNQDEEDESFSDVRMQLTQLSTPPNYRFQESNQNYKSSSKQNQQDQRQNQNGQATNYQNENTDNEFLVSQTLSSYQREKNKEYQNYMPQQIEDYGEEDDIQNAQSVKLRDKKSDIFTQLNVQDIKNPLIESSDQDLNQQQQQKQSTEFYNSNKNDTNQQKNQNSSRKNQLNIQEQNQYSPEISNQQQTQKNFQSPQNQKTIKKVHLKIEQKSKPQEQSNTPPQDQLRGYLQQYNTSNDSLGGYQYQQDQDNSIQQYENKMYNELKRTLQDQQTNNFTNFKVTPKGVVAVETSIQNNYQSKEKRKQKLASLSNLSGKQLKNFDSPQVFKIDLSKKTTPKSDYFSQQKFQFYSPTSKFNSRGFSSGTKGGINTSNTILNKDLASSIESQEGPEQFLTNNSANDVEIFYTQDEFFNNYNSADQNNRHNIYDQYKPHIRGYRSPSSYQTKKNKDLMTLNVDFDGQDLEVKVYLDDTAYTIGERICMTLQKSITREQMKNLAAIIQKRINDYTQSLQQIVEEIEDKKIKERDTLERYIRERNLRENILNPLPQKKQVGLNENKKEEIIGKLTIELNPNTKKQAIIRIREKDDPYELAFSFINTYNIKKNKISFLVEKIAQIQNEYRVQQSLKEQAQRFSSQNAYNDIIYQPFKESQGYYSAGQLSNLSPQKIQTPQSKTSNSPINFNQQQIQERGQIELFRVNLDKGNGDYIKIIVREGDNLKQLAYQVATDNQLNNNAYQKILKTLESAYKNFLENQWQAI